MLDNEKIKNAKKHFIYLLKNDEEVQNEIVKIVNGVETSSGDSRLKNDVEYNNQFEQKYDDLVVLYNALEKKYNNVKNEKELLEKQYYESEKRLSIQEKSYSKEISELQLKMDEIEEERKQLLKSYDGLERMYKLYLKLDSKVQKNLERILSPSDEISGSAELFLAYGVQEGNVIALWDAIAANVFLYEQQNCLDALCMIFKYFLNIHNSVSFKKTEIYIVEKGDIYDERYHTRTSNSSATGRIEKMILPGFSIGKNISKKALVVLEDK